MRRAVAAALGAALVLLSPAAYPASPSFPPKATLTAFASEQELADLFGRWREEERRRQEAFLAERSMARLAEGPKPAAAAPAPAKMQASMDKNESITNVQHAGVDEGGIVKVHGDHLVILRRGRLFTVAIGDRELRPIASIDAYGPDVGPQGAWYDEMLISGSTIVVIGYCYARGGTEIGVFEIADGGALAYKATYHLRSNDYYSSRNYASRLIGTKLVVYSPLRLSPYAPDPYAAFPAVRRWHAGATPADFRRIAPATRIYRADDDLDPRMGVALHSVTTCDVAKPDLECESTAVMGPPGRVFYVSPGAVYVWTTPRHASADPAQPAAAVFRIPLDGGAPSALRVAGSPIDQFSFLEDNGMLNVLVRAHGRGDGMWGAERSAGDLALLRVPLTSFSNGRDAAPVQAYRALPRAQGHALQSRYVGPYLLYGAGAGWHRPQAVTEGEVFAVRYVDGATFVVPVPHAVDRIEALGQHAVVVGSDGRDLHFSSVRLSRHPVATARYVRKNAAQGETRSHGFFYRPESDRDGLLGLPVIGGDEAAAGQLKRASAAVLYLRSNDLALSELGALAAQPAVMNDGCRASCVDWYGNSRPVFLRGRVFALMGYEIVEGRLDAKRIVETRRISFAPGRDLAVR